MKAEVRQRLGAKRLHPSALILPPWDTDEGGLPQPSAGTAPATVVTVYRTTKVRKYWRSEP